MKNRSPNNGSSTPEEGHGNASHEARESGPPVSDMTDLRGRTSSTGTHSRTELRRRLESTELETPTLDRVLYAALALNRQISVEMHDDEIVHAYVAALRELFPRRLFAIRLFAADTGQLSFVHATGRIRESARDSVLLSAEAVESHRINVVEDANLGIYLSEQYETIFANGAYGFDVPMMDGDRLMGVLGVEYPRGTSEPPNERPIIVQLGLQLGAALRNARLLRESGYLRDYLSKLLDHANAPIVVIGRHREIRVVNRAFLALTGIPREKLLGTDFSLLLPESERQRLQPVFLATLKGHPISNLELKLPRPGGFARLVVNAASIRSADGEMEGVIAIGRDLTEVRELEEQVIQSEKLATLGQLAAGVVHELNNPLTSISVYSDYLLRKYDGNIESADVEKLRRIVQSAERILRFTRDLVTYARPSTEEPRPVSMHQVLHQAVMFCDHIIHETGTEIVTRYADDLPKVLGVKGQLHQVFINLITNACHAMPEGAGRLVLEAEVTDPGWLCVRVRDNGQGIPPDQLSRVFEPFFSTKGEGKGTGLGLSIVRNIVHQHSGYIDVESQIGNGTTFSVVLPCESA